jgi:Tol biopolymer transport system component
MRGTLTPFTVGPGVDSYPVWTADGRRLIFTSEREGFNLFWQAADGTGAAERLTRSRNAQAATGVSPDGTRLIFTEYSETTSGQFEIYVRPYRDVKSGFGRYRPQMTSRVLSSILRDLRDPS